MYTLFTSGVGNTHLTLNHALIPVVKEFKFFGMLLDPKFIFDKHIYVVRLKCKKYLNILYVLINTSWGCNRQLLLTVYHSLVSSKLDYECQVYGSAIYYLFPTVGYCPPLRALCGSWCFFPLLPCKASMSQPMNHPSVLTILPSSYITYSICYRPPQIHPLLTLALRTSLLVPCAQSQQWAFVKVPASTRVK